MIEVIALVSTLLLTPTPPTPHLLTPLPPPTPTSPQGAPPGWVCGTPAPPPPTSEARWYYSLPVCTPAPRPTRTPAVVLPTVSLPTVSIPRLPLNATPTITPTPSPTPTLTPTPTPQPPAPALWLRVGVGDFGYQDYPLPHQLDVSGNCGGWSAQGGISSSNPRVRVHSQEMFTLTAEFYVEYSVCGVSRDFGCTALLAGQAQTENVIRVTVNTGQCESGSASISITVPSRYSTGYNHYYVPDLLAGAECEWNNTCAVNFNKTIRFYNIPPPEAPPTPPPTPTPACVPCRPLRTDLPPIADWEIVVEPGVCTTLLPAFQIPRVSILGWEVGGVGWDAVRICPRWVHVRASLAGVDLALLLGAAVALGSVWLIVKLVGGQ